MELKGVLAALGEGDCLEVVSPHWEESEACFPKDLPDFLQPEHIRENMKWGRLAEHMASQILEAARRIAEDPNLLHLIWHCYRLEYYYPDYGYNYFPSWPALKKSLGRELQGIFYLLVGLAAVPIVRAVHTEKGVDDKITRDTISDVRVSNWRYRKANDGNLGIVRAELAWYKNHASGRLYRLGRLQYFIHEFTGYVEIYRHRRTKEVLALAEDGMKMTDEGYIVFRGEEGTETWTTTHIVDAKANTAEGYVVSPGGMTLKQKVTLNLDEWEHTVGKRTFMLSMHIPVGGPMPLRQCVESMRSAFEFFGKFFPDKPVVGIDCYSWIFGNQLEDILEPDSNLVEFLREGYLYPMPSPRNEGHFFIFYRQDGDLGNYPRETEFQRQILDWLIAGGAWRGSGWFVLKDDVERLGNRFYRSHFPPKGVEIKT